MNVTGERGSRRAERGSGWGLRRGGCQSAPWPRHCSCATGSTAASVSAEDSSELCRVTFPPNNESVAKLTADSLFSAQITACNCAVNLALELGCDRDTEAQSYNNQTLLLSTALTRLASPPVG